jgi:hypothetical protein
MEKYARQHAPEPVAGAERVAELEAEVSRLQSELTSDDGELAKRAMGLAQKNLNLEVEVSRLTALLIEQGHTERCGSSRYYCSGCKTSFTDHWRRPAFGSHGECPDSFEWLSYPCNCHLSTLPAIKDGAK